METFEYQKEQYESPLIDTIAIEERDTFCMTNVEEFEW